MHTLICTVKRDGKTEVPFDANKIAVAISKAAYASGEPVDAASCTAKVLLALSEASVDGKVGVETIQDEVERVLMMNGHYLTAKKYIIYRQHRADSRAFKISTLTDLVDEYLGKCEWSIKENSNMDFSLQGLNQYVTAKAMSAYWLAKIFPPDVREAHNKGTIHVHDLNLLAPYCCGWDLRQLLLVGFSGVEGSNDSKPAKHFQQILGQCWNFLFTLQGEAAGAQAFSNFDTYLAPFIRFDKLSYREVKKALQTFFHNMTTKTRVGFQCVPDTYTCLTPEGWKYHHELRPGDEIYVFDVNTGEIRLDVLTHVNTYEYRGEMIQFTGRKLKMMTTPNHRTIRRKFNSNKYVIETSGDIYEKYDTPIDIPLAGHVNRQGVDMTDDEIRLLGWALTDAHMDKRGTRIRIYQSPKKYAHEIARLLTKLNADWYAAPAGGGGYGDEVYRFDVKGDLARMILDYTDGYREAIPLHFMNNASVDQIHVLLDTMILADGTIEESGRIRIAKKNDYMAECIQTLLVLSGYGSTRNRRLSCTDTVSVYKKPIATTRTEVVDYEGVVWCPTTDTGTFICRAEDGTPFITGNSPFTNITMDLTVPRYMKDEPVIRGGEFTDYTYGEFQEEMNIFNRALCEVMIEGDASGRQFSFPIPTYSITKDFDWDNEVLEPLWKLTAMYGAPYFTNYVNSDLNPEDVRSMCPLHPEEKIHVKINGSWMNMTIYAVYSFLANRMDKSEVYVMHKGKEIPVTGVSVHAAETFVRIRTVLDPEGVVFEGGHHQPFRTDGLGPMKKSTARSLRVGEYLPYSESTRENVGCPDGCFAQDGYVFAKITHKEILGKIHPYAYCIEVGTEDHLFDLKPGGLVTHNCRLQLDLTTLRRRGGGQFGANPLTGSIGVVTLNLPAMAYNAKGDKSKFFEAIIDGMEMAREILTLKREFVEKNVTLGLYPYTRRYLEDVAMVAENVKGKKEYMYNHFSTIGIVGGNEACLNLLGKSIMDDEGKDLMIEVLTMMRERCQKYAEETGYPFNLEATPAEGVSYRLAKLDRDQYPDIITASSCVCGADPFYTNSTQVPVNATTDIVEVCDNQDDLQTLYTGGTVLHVMLGESVKDPTVVKNLVRKLCSSYRIPYFTISPNYSVCANHGYLKGVQDSCPKCGGDTEIYSRVVGFYTPVSRWNKGKVQEFSMRNTYETSAVPLGEEDK